MVRLALFRVKFQAFGKGAATREMISSYQKYPVHYITELMTNMYSIYRTDRLGINTLIQLLVTSYITTMVCKTRCSKSYADDRFYYGRRLE